MTTISVLLGPTLSTGRAGFSPAPCQLLLPGLSAAEVCSPQPDLPLHPLGSLRETCSKTHKDPSTSPLRWAAGLTLPQWLPFPLPNVQTRNYSLDFVLHNTTLDNSAYFYLVSSVYSAGKQTGDGITTNIPGAGIPVAQCSFYREAKKTHADNFAWAFSYRNWIFGESLQPGFLSLQHYTLVCVRVCGFPGGIVVKNLPDNAEVARDTGSIPGSSRFPGVRNGNRLQHSCLERGAWWVTVQGVTKSWTWLSDWTCTHVVSAHMCIHTHTRSNENMVTHNLAGAGPNQSVQTGLMVLDNLGDGCRVSSTLGSFGQML